MCVVGRWGGRGCGLVCGGVPPLKPSEDQLFPPTLQRREDVA